jgi:hypothetical protein
MAPGVLRVARHVELARYFAGFAEKVQANPAARFNCWRTVLALAGVRFGHCLRPESAMVAGTPLLDLEL